MFTTINFDNDYKLVKNAFIFKDLYNFFIDYDHFSNPLINLINANHYVEKKLKSTEITYIYINDYIKLPINHLINVLPGNAKLIIFDNIQNIGISNQNVQLISIPSNLQLKDRNNKILAHLFKIIQNHFNINFTKPNYFPNYIYINSFIDLTNYIDREFETKIITKNYIFDMIVNLKSKSDFLVIINQSAAAPLKETIRPQYQRWSWTHSIISSTITVCDPMKEINTSLRAGWWIGYNEFNLVEYFTKQIQQLAHSLKIPSDHIVFYGGSAGGFSSIMMSIYLKGSIFISDIPQINLTDYQFKAEVEAAILSTYKSIDDCPLYFLDINQAIKRLGYFPKGIFLQNINDLHHFYHHFISFYNSSDKSKVWYYYYDFVHPIRGGHVPLGKNSSITIINYVIMNIKLNNSYNLSIECLEKVGFIKYLNSNSLPRL